MSIKDLGTVDAVENLASQEMNVSPFMEGRTVQYVVDCDAWNGTAKLQSSDDDSNWSDEVTVTESGSDRTIRGNVTLAKYMRWMASARTGGEADCHLEAGN